MNTLFLVPRVRREEGGLSPTIGCAGTSRRDARQLIRCPTAFTQSIVVLPYGSHAPCEVESHSVAQFDAGAGLQPMFPRGRLANNFRSAASIAEG